MKKNFLIISFIALGYASLRSQNVGINTTGAAPAATNLLEVLSTSTTASSIGIYSAHSGAITGTGYGIWAQKTGASTTNIASYFTASGATNNYAIIVPSGGGNVGIGATSPNSKLEIGTSLGSGSNINSTSGYDLGIHHSALRITSVESAVDGYNTSMINLLLSKPGAYQGITGNLDFEVRDRGNNSNHGILARITGGALTDGFFNNGMLAFTTANSGTLNERMRIDNSGNVGIATTSPGSALDVKGTMRLSGSTSGYVGFAPSAVAGSTTYTLPSADGSSGQVLKTDGAGTLAWTSTTPYGSAMFVQTNSVSVAGTTAETSILGTGVGTLTIPANTLSAGSHVKVRVVGYAGRFDGTATFKLKLGGTVVCASAASTWASGLSDFFEIDLDFTCRAASAGGSVWGQGLYNSGNTTEIPLQGLAATPIDTTVPLTIDVTITLSSGAATNSIISTNATVFRYN